MPGPEVLIHVHGLASLIPFAMAINTMCNVTSSDGTFLLDLDLKGPLDEFCKRPQKSLIRPGLFHDGFAKACLPVGHTDETMHSFHIIIIYY